MSAASAAFSISGHHLLVLVLRLLQLPFQKAGLGQELVVQRLLLRVVPFCLQKFGLWEGYLRQDMKYHWIVWDSLGFSPITNIVSSIYKIISNSNHIPTCNRLTSDSFRDLQFVACCLFFPFFLTWCNYIIGIIWHPFPPLPSHHHHNFHHLILSPPCRQQSVLDASSPTRSKTKQMKFCIVSCSFYLILTFHCLPRSLYKRSHTLAPTLQVPPSPTFSNGDMKIRIETWFEFPADYMLNCSSW